MTTYIKDFLFKSRFLDFLMKEYGNPKYASVIEEKELCCSIDNKCRKFIVWMVLGNLKQFLNYFRDHLEGDTRVLFHTKGPANIIIRGNNTNNF